MVGPNAEEWRGWDGLGGWTRGGIKGHLRLGFLGAGWSGLARGMERARARVELWPTTVAGGGVTLTKRPAGDALRAVSRCAAEEKAEEARWL